MRSFLPFPAETFGRSGRYSWGERHFSSDFFRSNVFPFFRRWSSSEFLWFSPVERARFFSAPFTHYLPFLCFCWLLGKLFSRFHCRLRAGRKTPSDFDSHGLGTGVGEWGRLLWEVFCCRQERRRPYDLVFLWAKEPRKTGNFLRLWERPKADYGMFCFEQFRMALGEGVAKEGIYIINKCRKAGRKGTVNCGVSK